MFIDWIKERKHANKLEQLLLAIIDDAGIMRDIDMIVDKALTNAEALTNALGTNVTEKLQEEK